MITLKIKDDDWSAAKDHWIAVKGHLTDKASIAKADFIDDVIFNTTSASKTTATEIDFPSVSVMTELINEIDNETKMDVDQSNRNTSEPSEEVKLEDNVKKFICEPVNSTITIFILAQTITPT